jgi:osmotically-inducible protein OsmY
LWADGGTEYASFVYGLYRFLINTKEREMTLEEKPTRNVQESTNVGSSMVQEVKDAISHALGSKIRDLSVSVKGEDVTVLGKVEEASQIATVTSIVERIKGVKGLENRVTAASSGKMPEEKAMSTPSAKAPTEKTMATPTVGMKKEASPHEASSGGSGCG